MGETPQEEASQPVFVILGAAGGIGSTVARRLHASGARLMLAGRTRAKLEPLANELAAKACEIDATIFEPVERCLREAQAWAGKVDGVLNCAGSILLKPAHLTTAAELQEVLALNLVSAFATVRAAANVMRKSGGSIVLMTSAAAEIGLANHEAIAAAKAGVIGLMRSPAATYAAQGWRLSASRGGRPAVHIQEAHGAAGRSALKTSPARRRGSKRFRTAVHRALLLRLSTNSTINRLTSS